MSRVWLIVAAIALIACSDGETASSPASGGSAGALMTGGRGGEGAAGASGGGGSGGAVGGGGPVSTFEVITDRHRYDPGKMFGGWGQHLGHLVRSGATLWFVDDYCAQASGSGAVCDVNDNHTLGYFEHTNAGWVERDTVALPGLIQQNTATIVDPASGELHTYGIDSGTATLYECRYAPATGPLGCSALPFTLVASSNYVGAGVSPQGYRVVWWTGVVDGGGGSFHYLVDYGGGWNGPRSGTANGANDASYAHVAFGGSAANDFTMHVQFVTGLAPNWTFTGGVGYGDFGTSNPVAWAAALVAPVGTTVFSTNDIWTDPATGDTHMIVRLENGAAAYYHRPPGGAWSGALFELAATYRARFVFSEDRLALVYGPNAGGLAYRIAEAADRPAAQPIDWAGLSAQSVDVIPSDWGAVLAIYPESPMHQTTAAEGIHVTIVGASGENHVGHVIILH